MAGPIQFRAVTAADEVFLRRVYASTRADELACVDWTPEQKEAFLRMQFDAQQTHYRTHYPEAHYWIIEHRGEPAGRLYLARLANEFRIIDIALLPLHRRQGVGSKILGDILTEAVVAKKPVRIHVERFNPALRLYQRLGFALIEEGPVYLLMEKSP